MLCLATFVLATALGGAVAQCPDYANGLLNAAWSESAGCLWADADETHRFDNFDQAKSRCK